jgi:hypothetical protein
MVMDQRYSLRMILEEIHIDKINYTVYTYVHDAFHMHHPSHPFYVHTSSMYWACEKYVEFAGGARDRYSPRSRVWRCRQ